MDLDEKKYDNLEALLDQTTIYSKFLSEQMVQLNEDENDGKLAKKKQKKGKSGGGSIPGGGAADGGKGAGGGVGGGRSGRGDAADAATLSETQKLLPMMTVNMRDYQLKGVKWLIALYQNGLNGILADQMGLGKTVQTIGFLSHLRSKGVLGPYLVIGPLSTLSNWVNEFHKFCPSFPVVL